MGVPLYNLKFAGTKECPIKFNYHLPNIGADDLQMTTMPNTHNRRLEAKMKANTILCLAKSERVTLSNN